MAALGALSPPIGIGTQVSRPRTMSTCGLRQRLARRCLRPSCTPGRLSVGYRLIDQRRFASPFALATRVARRRRRLWRWRRLGRAPLAKEHVPKPLRTQLGLLEGKHHPEIHPNHALHHPGVIGTQVALMHACNQSLACFCTQRYVVRWLLHNRFLDVLIANAAGGAGRPWPPDMCAWLGAAVTAAARQVGSARRVLPGVDRSPLW